MPSLIAGYDYEYDIFISYRHKDNKYDGWVSDFVSNLRKELEATFKDDISIYFDENPHDGLLETHNVDKSVQKKLKCLILLPILSQTYCDPKSFAWKDEFVAFVKMEKEDRLGLEINLLNGNVCSRILPVSDELLKVIGRTSSFQFEGDKVDLRDIGEKLQVATVLEGSIRKSGDKVRTRSVMGHTLLGLTYEREGNFDVALHHFRIAEEMEPEAQDPKGLRVLTLARAEKETEAENIFERSKKHWLKGAILKKMNFPK